MQCEKSSFSASGTSRSEVRISWIDRQAPEGVFSFTPLRNQHKLNSKSNKEEMKDLIHTMML